MQDYGIFARPDKVRGIIAIRNLRSGKVLLEKTEDAVKSFRDERFRLDLGIHTSRELQEDYASTGLELFTIELEEECGEDVDLDDLLQRVEERYRKEGDLLYKKG